LERHWLEPDAHLDVKILLRRFEEEDTGNREHNKETWIDFRKDLVGVGIE